MFGRRGQIVLGIVVSVGALALILKDVSFPKLMHELARANYWWQIPNVTVLLVSMWIRALRWRALLDDRLPVHRSFHIQNVGSFLNNVLPLRLGELSKAYLASRDSTLTVMQALSAVVIERLLDVLAVFVMLLVVLPWVPAGGMIVRGAQMTAAIALVGMVVLFVAAAMREPAMRLARSVTGWAPQGLREGVLATVDELLRGVRAAGGKRLVVAIGWSVVMWIGYGISSYVILLSFIPNSEWFVAGFVTCALALGLSIPSAPSGVGLYEAAAVAGLAVFRVPADTALAYALVLHVANFILVAVMGVIGLEREGERFGHLATAARGMMGKTKAA